MHRPNMCDTPMIFCLIPHGVAPFGATAYPVWSKLWSDKLCHWTAAPAVLSIPIVSYYLKAIGYIPAKGKNIHETLTKKEENVGIFLDGIAGMFQTHANEETAYVKSRKGVIKIAMRAGAKIVPVYAFGHTSLWTVIVDPMGVMEKLSNHLGVSLTPFFGRWGWFLGPPRRVPITVVCGEPITCPLLENPTKEQVDEYHQKMLDAYQQVFDKHKEAYGWEKRELKFV
jgi:1-acyl-sn-glycerol-3-phosphate acyltransferase